jgi:hypothetical protein
MAARQTPQDLIDPGAMLAGTHELDDGSRVRLRLTRPTDLARIEAFLGDSVQARRLAFYDPRERLFIAATMPGERGEEIVGIAEAVLFESGPTEVGTFVLDELADAGLGELLAGVVASLSASRRQRAA